MFYFQVILGLVIFGLAGLGLTSFGLSVEQGASISSGLAICCLGVYHTSTLPEGKDTVGYLEIILGIAFAMIAFFV